MNFRQFINNFNVKLPHDTVLFLEHLRNCEFYGCFFIMLDLERGFENTFVVTIKIITSI